MRRQLAGLTGEDRGKIAAAVWTVGDGQDSGYWFESVRRPKAVIAVTAWYLCFHRRTRLGDSLPLRAQPDQSSGEH